MRLGPPWEPDLFYPLTRPQLLEGCLDILEHHVCVILSWLCKCLGNKLLWPLLGSLYRGENLQRRSIPHRQRIPRAAPLFLFTEDPHGHCCRSVSFRHLDVRKGGREGQARPSPGRWHGESQSCRSHPGMWRRREHRSGPQATFVSSQ